MPARIQHCSLLPKLAVLPAFRSYLLISGFVNTTFSLRPHHCPRHRQMVSSMQKSGKTPNVAEATKTTARRLVIACDGTWMNSDSGFVKDSWVTGAGHLQTPSNVTRIARAIRPETDNGIPQIVYYQAGIGTEGSWWDHVYGGGTGTGLSENIREAYGFLAKNYMEGDEIFLIGFSRGAFTARSIGAMIASVGLLTTKGMEQFYPIFSDWENQVKPKDWKSPFPNQPFPNKRRVTDPSYTAELERLEFTRMNIPIRAIAVWDTVGSLGIPQTGLFQPRASEYSFVDTKVPANIEHAFHALALDERRKPFTPTIWEVEKGSESPLLKQLRQCWFPGVHSNVGGSYDDTGIANISLAWMMNQLAPFLEFEPGYLLDQYEAHVEYCKTQKGGEYRGAVRPWGLSRIYNSKEGLNEIGPSAYRTPGDYNATDPNTGITGNRKLVDTRETIHASVRIRKVHGGKGEEDQGNYDPPALKGFKLVGTPGANNVRWEAGSKRVLQEDVLGPVEKELLAKFPAIGKYVNEG